MNIEIPPFQHAKILVVGDLMLDRYWHGAASRISAEAPVQVLNVGQMEERPGGAGNVALNIASLGGHAEIIALTGDDEAAQQLEVKLTAAKVKCHLERDSSLTTITKLRIISRQQQLLRLDFEQHFNGQGAEKIKQAMQSKLEQVDLVILSDYAKGTLHQVEQLIKLAKAQSKPVLVDPKGKDFSKYFGATLVTPNLHEFEAVVGRCHDEQTLIERGNQLLIANQWQALLITRGEQGMTLLRPNKPELHFPTQAHEVFDVTGAGDTVIATLASALAAGSELEDAVALANTAAGVVVAKLGTAGISAHELRRKVRTTNQSGTGVVSQQQLAVVVADAKAHGEKIVMTNGCFDILHAGHVAYLQQAKALGDRLIVAVNSDSSVKQLKGQGRPVNSIERRMSVLAGLGSVDWVVEFSESTPQNLIANIIPDVLVKGGDYQVKDIAGGEEVLKNGGKVEVLSFIEGVSTSKIIDSINQNKRA
jgi:D-beta-D-heptose 7-phosphate kinase / D-beta-D-heptose 1-phosphate adenosyltransferase